MQTRESTIEMYLVYIARPTDNVHPTDDSISNI